MNFLDREGSERVKDGDRPVTRQRGIAESVRTPDTCGNRRFDSRGAVIPTLTEALA
jgi:hypothetical protein